MPGRGLWRGRGGVWRTALVLLCLLLVAAGLLGAALVTDVGRGALAPRVAAEPSVTAPEPALRPASADAPGPSAPGLAAVVGPLAENPAAGTLTGRVVDDATGDVLWERDPNTPVVPASTIKLLTAVAALGAIPGDARVDTVLAEGREAGSLVVLPGGDVSMGTRSASPLFPGSTTLDEMADLVRRSGVRPTSLVVAPGPYSGEPLGPGWERPDIAAGNIAPVEPWMTDSGRVDPSDEFSPRVDQPQLVAARALGERLGVPAGQVSIAATAVETVRELGRVRSAPLGERVRSMLVHSDNVLAESVCRQVAQRRDPQVKVGFSGSTAAVVDVLREKGVDTTGVVMQDCSGMSPGNKVSAAVLASVLRMASAPGASRDLRGLLDALPVAGASGTLAGRYDGPAAPGAGWVRAKTGTLTGTTALAGTVTTVEGRALSFAFLSSGTSPSEARPAIDRMAAALRGCGCR